MFVYDFWQWEEVVPKADCEKIITQLFNSASPEQGKIVELHDTHSVVEGIRQTDVVWSNNPELSQMALQYVNAANVESGWHINATMLEQIQIGRYGVGGHYDWHKDTLSPIDGIQRKLSLSLQLSDPNTYEGGDLLIGGPNSVPATRKQGSIIVFPSCQLHKVTPVTKGERFSVVAWVRGPQFR